MGRWARSVSGRLSAWHLDGALRHDLDFFTGRCQPDLCRANRVFAAVPVGHLQGFAKRLGSTGVVASFGEHAQSAQAQLAFHRDIFLLFIGRLQVIQNRATGQGSLDGGEFQRLGLQGF